DSAGVNGSELYAAVLRDQWLNIVVVVPLLILLNAGAAFAIRARPDLFIARDAHLILIAAEALGLSGYLWFVIRGFTKLTPLIAATREDWRTQPAELPDE
ncbi:MAG: hypothetical protein ACJ8KX_05790, partial [Chthoniobacterales bacterium]